MPRLRPLGTTLMVSLAIAIQPVQYGLLAGVGRALAQQTCDPPVYERAPGTAAKAGTITPQDLECQPTVLPGSPPGTPPTASVKYYLLPGIGDGGPTNGKSTYFNPTKLEDFLATTNQTAIPVTTTQAWADWKAKNLTDQGRDLAAQVGSEATGTAKAILVGHSMGGLRARSALQFNTNAYPGLKTNVLAMVTLGTPHLGAPIINLGKPAATLLGGVFGTALSGFFGLGPYLPGAVGMFGARAWAASIVNTPSGQDMRPDANNAFLNRLNQPSTSERIPSNVVVLRVVGQNSDIDSYGASANIAPATGNVRGLRTTLGGFFAVAGGFAMVMGIFTFGATIPWALALLASAYLLLNLPTFWRDNVMGAPTGDGVVPEASQRMPAVGGKQPVADLDLPFAVHTGRYGEYQAQSTDEYKDNLKLQTRLRELQTALNIPVSQ